VKEKRIHRVYEQEFRDRAVEMVIHSGKSQAEVAVHGGRWWRSRRIKWPAATRDPANESEPEFRTYRTRETAHAASRCGIQTGKIWSAFGSGQLGLVVLGPRANRVLLSELDRWWRSKRPSH
jgi:hypothetical protein